MKCTTCNSELSNVSTFCPYCGSRIEPAAAQPPPPARAFSPAVLLDQLQEPHEPTTDYNPGTATGDIAESSTIFCGRCGHQAAEKTAVCDHCGTSPTVPAEDSEQKHTKGKLGLWIIAAVASLLVVVLIAGLCTNWFGFYGPATKIAVAANNTLRAGNLTMDLQCELSLNKVTTNIDGSIAVMIDPENRDLKLYTNLDVGNQNILITIYDDYLIIKYRFIKKHQNIRSELDTFFDHLEKDKTLDWEELLNSIQDGLYDEVSEYIAFDVLEKCLVQYYRNLNTDKWLEEYAGYSLTEENGVSFYRFKPKSYAFLDTSLSCFEPAFVDERKYDDLANQLESSKEKIEAYATEVAIGVEKKKLTSIELALRNDSYCADIKIDFSKIGETSIDESMLKRILLEAL